MQTGLRASGDLETPSVQARQQTSVSQDLPRVGQGGLLSATVRPTVVNAGHLEEALALAIVE